MNDALAVDAVIAAARNQFPGAQKWTYLESSARGLLPEAARNIVAGYVDACIEGNTDKKALLDTIEHEQAATYVNAEIAKWVKVVMSAGITAD